MEKKNFNLPQIKYEQIKICIDTKADILSDLNVLTVTQFLDESKLNATITLDQYIYATEQFYSEGKITNQEQLMQFTDFTKGYVGQMKLWQKENDICLNPNIIALSYILQNAELGIKNSLFFYLVLLKAIINSHKTFKIKSSIKRHKVIILLLTLFFKTSHAFCHYCKVHKRPKEAKKTIIRNFYENIRIQFVNEVKTYIIGWISQGEKESHKIIKKYSTI